MSEPSDWLDANTRYMTAAVAWVRALLQSRANPPPSSLPAASGTRSLWRGRRLPPAAPIAPEVALITDEREGLAGQPAYDMDGIAAQMTPPPALLLLEQRLGLSKFERQVLLLCAAMELDTSIAGLCAQAQDDASRPYPTFALALTLFSDPSWDALSPERPLRHWRLIEINQPGTTPLATSPLRADERIVNFLKGLTYLDDRLTPLLAPMPDPGQLVPPSQQAAADAIVRQIGAVADGESLPAIQLLGSDAASKRIVAALVGRALNRQPYRLDWTLLPTVPADLEWLARLWQRESRLLPIALYLDTESSEGGHAASVDRLLARIDGLVFLATRNLWPGTLHAPIAAEIDKPTAQEQRDCWRAVLGAEKNATAEALAAQFNVNAATIREFAQRQAADVKADPATLDQRLWDECRALTRPRLDLLARRLMPRATWDDIVLPPTENALLHQIVDQVGQRGKVYREWGFAQRMSRGLGISVLFAGPPGSGKTMASEVIANHLRLDLFRIDLSGVMSKYIGETEANLRRLFDAAEDGGAILLFDEADALFGKRTEVKDSHDRYANIEINYLLQRMEAYGGLAILATNMKSALDQAFMRRLRFVVDFPFPGAAERKAMWEKAFPGDTPTRALDFDRLARLSVTGGHIAVIAINAAFQAAQAGTDVTMPVVLNAARIEFRKLGRPINEADFRWQGAVA
jgi:hypothetical protein